MHDSPSDAVIARSACGVENPLALRAACRTLATDQYPIKIRSREK
jgi:hypothetical protein